VVYFRVLSASQVVLDEMLGILVNKDLEANGRRLVEVKSLHLPKGTEENRKLVRMADVLAGNRTEYLSNTHKSRL
jgi:hypothetical protein